MDLSKGQTDRNWIMVLHQSTVTKSLLETLSYFKISISNTPYARQKHRKEIADILEVNSHKMRIKLHSQPPIEQSH
jgi:hypothetical protein